MDALSKYGHLLLALLGAGVVVACDRDQPASLQPAPAAKTAETIIHESPRLTSIESTRRDGLGRPVRVACVTCHSVRPTGPFPQRAGELREFHVGLRVDHGPLACGDCHVARAGGIPKLHLASGAEIDTAETLRLCAQCHGPKYQDYVHGSHGGMNGYWDLSRGARLRNHCVDCHDPHVPKPQQWQPVLPPRDRPLERPLNEKDTGEHNG